MSKAKNLIDKLSELKIKSKSKETPLEFEMDSIISIKVRGTFVKNGKKEKGGFDISQNSLGHVGPKKLDTTSKEVVPVGRDIASKIAKALGVKFNYQKKNDFGF